MKQYEHPDLKDISLSTAMQALADPCRITILKKLWPSEETEISCNEVQLTLSKGTVSHHFETLRAAGLIHTRVEGTKCLSNLRKKEFSTRFPGLLELAMREAQEAV